MEKFDGFADREDIYRQFFDKAYSREPVVVPMDFPTEGEILLAVYDTPPYEGSAWVVYRQGGKLYEVNGGHCSCYGLEGQWTPEETSKEAILMRPTDGYGCVSQARLDYLKEVL